MLLFWTKINFPLASIDVISHPAATLTQDGRYVLRVNLADAVGENGSDGERDNTPRAGENLELLALS